MSDRLQQVFKPLLNADTCSQQLGALFDRRTMMCAGRDEGGAGACFVRALHIGHGVNSHHHTRATYIFMISLDFKKKEIASTL